MIKYFLSLFFLLMKFCFFLSVKFKLNKYHWVTEFNHVMHQPLVLGPGSTNTCFLKANLSSNKEIKSHQFILVF